MSILKKIENYFQSEEQRRQNKEIRLKIEMVDRNLFETKKLIQSVLNIMKKNKMAGDEIEKRLSKLESTKDNSKSNAYFVNEKQTPAPPPEVKIPRCRCIPAPIPEQKVGTAAGEFIWEKPAPIPEQIKPKRGRKPGKSKLDQFKTEIIKDYKSKIKVYEVCGKYKTSDQALHRWLKRNGIKLRTKKRAK